jgi:hypothetical protein
MVTTDRLGSTARAPACDGVAWKLPFGVARRIDAM